MRWIWAASAVVVAIAGCSSAPAQPSASGPVPTTAAPPAAAPTGLGATRLLVPAGLAEAPFDQPREVRAPAGWTVALWARLPGARLMAWAPDGSLLVSRPGPGDVVRLAPAAGGQPRQTTLVDGLTQPHGLAFDGSTLYVAESDAITSYRYDQGGVSGRKVIVGGLPDAKSPELHGQYAHALKSVAVGTDGWLYFSIGSTGNVSPQDRSADPQRAVVMRVDAGGRSRAEVYAHGVRNGTGLAVAPDGAVWTAVNNRDNIAYPWTRDYDGDGSSDLGNVLQAYVNDHPLEPLARLTPGRDLGWPYCDPDPDVTPGAPDTRLTYANRPFVRDQQLNADGSKLDCSALPPVEQGLGAHSAPLGLSFVPDGALPAPFGQGALVGVHGSWNRTPPRAPEVSFFPWHAGGLGAQQTLLGGFQARDGSRWGRPVMAVVGPDRAVYITDDSAGAIYRMVPAGR